ncbi:MAG: activase [Spirochaetales bacterium]|nr:activase [Spirochaetales bacterium]
MDCLGVNIGSSSLKIVCLREGEIAWSGVAAHEGDFVAALTKIAKEKKIPEGTRALITGTEGRFLFNIDNIIEPLCIETAIKYLQLQVDAVVTMGGEDLIVYAVDRHGRIVNNFSGSKCASGTGEFFKQQLARMDMTLDDVDAVPESACVFSLSSRCSVFMKSDCTHRLNKREATTADIVVSLSDVMATKVVDFLKKARISSGRVLLTGGQTRNRHIVKFMREKAPDIEFVVPEVAEYFEAYGAAVMACDRGSPFPAADDLVREGHINFERLEPLDRFKDMVTYFDTSFGSVKPGREYILGVDGGSTTTKACLIDMETDEIVASHYGRTHGDPVKALKGCLQIIRDKIREDIGSQSINISIAATTGSSREILGVFLETPGVYNEIIAHSCGTTYFSDDVDTIFEIGGQDAKYVFLKNGVPIDYAMNEACSAGTGSFLEESAAGDLNIGHAWEIGEIAVKAKAPLKFGEHCSAFINSDIRKAIQLGASKEDITAGVVTSIVSNYLNRVVGNRTIGGKIFLQGGVAKNKAVPLAFAMYLRKEILVPPAPELMGCFGVGILARRKNAAGLLDKMSIDLEALINRDITYERVFTCKSCENLCPIQVLNVNGHRYSFGGRCNKYANTRKKIETGPSVVDYVEKRNELLFSTCAPDPQAFQEKRDFTVGIPSAFSVYSLNPLYSWFFHSLGIKTVRSDKVEHEGLARVESNYCFPAEIAHGAVQDILNKGVDYIFVPHFRDMPSFEEKVHATTCPITQGLPYYLKKAFPEVPESKWLPVVVSFKFGKAKALSFFVQLGAKLGISAAESEAAFNIAYDKQQEYFQKAAELGREALEDARNAAKPVIVLFGRPYNAFTSNANMGIPRKFTTRGYTIVPFDILPFEGEEIFENMYWYYGQQNMKATALLAGEPNLYVAYISNFSCAPDSFMLHYVKWLMGTKPFLILELDSHSADAGIDTRVEAFLDIIEGYNIKKSDLTEERYDNGLRFINEKGKPLYILNTATGEEIPYRNNPRVKMLLSNMGDLSTRLMAAIIRSTGHEAKVLPVSDAETLHLARSYASGKECVPTHLVLGSVLKFLMSEEYRKDEIYLVFVPVTTGPCRTGQYYVFYQNLFRDLRLENVVVVTMSADNSYNELGPHFSRHTWYGLVISDMLKDIQTTLRTCAVNKEDALAQFKQLWGEIIDTAQKDIRKIFPVLKRAAREVSEIPRQRELADCAKVLIVGEIYVRRDDFAVDELVRLLSEKGIIGKASGVGEWIHYVDFVREYRLKNRIALIPLRKRLFSPEMKEYVVLQIEKWWKHRVERKVGRVLTKSRLLPHTPHNMRKIMANTEANFLSHELSSEIAVSSGVAATAMEEGYSGVINISPFACLIGRVIEGIYYPWAREKRYPMLSVEVDGNLLPPNIISKLNIFMVNVLRFRNKPESLDFVVPAEGSPNSSAKTLEKETVR